MEKRFRNKIIIIIIIRYRHCTVLPGSPFSVDFLDASQITASGEGLSLVPTHRHTDFLVHAPVANLKELTVDVTGPDGRSIPAHLRDQGNGTYKVDWVPATVGE